MPHAVDSKPDAIAAGIGMAKVPYTIDIAELYHLGHRCDISDGF